MPQTVKPKDEIECFCCGQTFVAGDNVPVEQAQHVCNANAAIADVAASLAEIITWMHTAHSANAMRPGHWPMIDRARQRLGALQTECPLTVPLENRPSQILICLKWVGGNGSSITK